MFRTIKVHTCSCNHIVYRTAIGIDVFSEFLWPVHANNDEMFSSYNDLFPNTDIPI